MMRGAVAWPAGNGPRERLARNGAGDLSEVELLAVLVRVGHASTGESAVDVARGLLTQFGSLRRLDRASVHQLRGVPGIGPGKAAVIKAAFEIARRLEAEPWRPGVAMRSSRDVYRHFRARLAGLRHETFHVVLLDMKNRLLNDVKISEGSLSTAIVHPREVFRPVIEESAAAVILVHNHPSGDPTPSPEDLALTTRLRAAGEVIGIRVLDHVIIGADGYASLVERGEI
jgi:DNA repair protein RadC